MAEKRPSKVVIEPSDRVVEALRLALAEVGLEEILRRTGARSERLEKWINGEEPVPLNVVKEACDINSENPKAPSYSKILSDCTAGTSFKIIVGKEAEKPAAPIISEIVPRLPRIPEERMIKPRAKAVKPKAFRQMAMASMTLFIIPILSVVIGFFLGGFTGALVGAILGFVIITAFTYAFFVLFPKKSRRT